MVAGCVGGGGVPHEPHHLLHLSERCCTSVPRLKLIHALFIKQRHYFPRRTTSLILAKLLRFAAVSPSGSLRYAAHLFSYHNLQQQKHAFFYNSLIRGHARASTPSLSLSLFNAMRRSSVPPDSFSFTFLLAARSRCSSAVGDVHAQALKFGCLGPAPPHLHVHNALIHLYASTGCPAAAQQVFDEMLNPDVFSWTALLTASLRAHDLDAARRIFDNMPERDVVAWTTMIFGYARARRLKEALEVFRIMPVPPDEVMMVAVISACTAMGDLAAGKDMHRYIEERGFGWMLSLRNALLNMYAKCGCLNEARQVFDGTQPKSRVTWNSMILAYATHGDADAAIDLFHRMVGRVTPDGATFLAVLIACAHRGLVDQGRRVFEAMRAHTGAGVEHYGCMVDMLGRAGLLEEALHLIVGMPVPGNSVVWGALLGACRIHGDVEMGERAIKKLMELKPLEGGFYILLSEIYATFDRQVDAAQVRRVMKERGASKSPGCSSSSCNNNRAVG